MRLGWTTGKYSITYRAVKTIRINGKNKRDGIPISFSIYPGNRNEQMTMIPLEQKMLEKADNSPYN